MKWGKKGNLKNPTDENEKVCIKKKAKKDFFLQLWGQEKVEIGTAKNFFSGFFFAVLKLESGVAKKQKG